MNQILKRQPVVVNPLYTHEKELRYSLSGEWLFRLDPNDVGVKERWFDFSYIFQEYIRVPGNWQGQGFGSDAKENQKEFNTDFRALRATYEGTGWYAKTFTVPVEWTCKRIWLNFGGACPTAEIWLNGIRIGEHHSPMLSFGFEITDLVKDGENLLAIRISEYDRILAFTYHYSGKWSGLYRDVELTATDAVYIDQLYAHPDTATGVVQIKTEIGGIASNARLAVKLTAPDGRSFSGEATVTGNTLALEIRVEDPDLWSPEHPALYRVDAELTDNGRVSDARSHRVGFAKLSTSGRHFLINGQPYYMRGTGDFCENPLTGSPNTDRDYWRRALGMLRKMGYLYVRCQSYVPVPEYFDAADEVGLLVQSEMGTLGAMYGKTVWNTYNMWPKPTPEYRERIREQWNGIVMRDVNHPSANIYCMGNELPGTFFPKAAWRCYNETKALKPSCMIIWSDGSYLPDLPQDFVNGQYSKEELFAGPVIQHEFKWWSSYPDASIAHKFKNAAMRHMSAEMMVERAAQRGLLHILPAATKNTQRLQVIEAKGKIEKLRREIRTLAGISHFNAMDIGPSPQGILDNFYDLKCVTPEVWKQTNGDTVVLCSKDFEKRILTPGEEFRCKLFISDFSHPAFASPSCRWSLESDGEVLADGALDFEHTAYITTPIGELCLTVPSAEKPVKVALKACVTSRDGRTARNSWDFWIIPKVSTKLPREVYRSKDGELPRGKRVVVTPRLTPELVRLAERGGVVILMASEGLVRPYLPFLSLNTGRYFFTRPASYPPYEELQSGTIILDHPILGDFPHEGLADLQFYNMIAESPALDLEGLGLHDGADPIIRQLHAYQIQRPLGYLIERRLGKGRIIVNALKIDDVLPESKYLLHQMIGYAESKNWADAPEITPDALERLISGSNID